MADEYHEQLCIGAEKEMRTGKACRAALISV